MDKAAILSGLKKKTAWCHGMVTKLSYTAPVHIVSIIHLHYKLPIIIHLLKMLEFSLVIVWHVKDTNRLFWFVTSVLWRNKRDHRSHAAFQLFTLFQSKYGRVVCNLDLSETWYFTLSSLYLISHTQTKCGQVEHLGSPLFFWLGEGAWWGGVGCFTWCVLQNDSDYIVLGEY